MNLGTLITRQAERHNEKIAIKYGDKVISYTELNQSVNQLSNGLLSIGTEKKDRVAVVLHNSNEYIEVFWAIAKIGAVLVPINWRLSANEIKYVLNDSGAEVLIYDIEFASKVYEIKDKLTCIEHFISVGGKDRFGNEYESFLKCQPVSEPSLAYQVELKDLFIIMYTSGTTGFPKGAMLSQKNIFWTSINQIVDWEVTSSDITLVVAPMFHVGGLLIFTLPAIHTGSSMVILRRFEVKRVLQAFENEGITTMFGAPTMFHEIAKQGHLVKKYSFKNLRSMCSGGASLPRPVMKQVSKHFPGVCFTEGYGVTESASCTSVLRSEDLLSKRGSIGKPFIHNLMRVVDSKGNDVKTGEIGEIILSGPTVMEGYWNRPSETKAAFMGKWFKTGDLATVDDDGFPYIIDRKKDMIISGAENIYPKEIENILYNNPKISEVAVIGVPDEKWGESVMALIVLKQGENMTTEEVISICIKELASYKKPKYIKFVKELPKNPSGKILKHLLKEKFKNINEAKKK